MAMYTANLTKMLTGLERRSSFCQPLLTLLLLSVLHRTHARCAIEPGGSDGHVNVPESWTDIPDEAFRACYLLRSIDIPDTVTRLGVGAFMGCVHLAEVRLPAYLTAIPDELFKDCSPSLQAIAIPESVTSVGARAFAGTGLAAVILPDAVTSLGVSAFQQSLSLVHVTLPANLTAIPANCFEDCRALCTINVPNAVTSVGREAFQGSGLVSIILPDTATSLGIAAFSWCESLVEVTLPANLVTIPEGCFSHCESLQTIAIPHTVTSMGTMAFRWSSSLTTVSIPDALLIPTDAFTTCGGSGNRSTSVFRPPGVCRCAPGSCSPTASPQPGPIVTPAQTGPAFGLTECGRAQLASLQTAHRTAPYYVNESITIPGFGGHHDYGDFTGCGTRSAIFAGNASRTAPSNISFAIEIRGGATLGEEYDACVGAKNGRVTITPHELGMFPALLWARDGNGHAYEISSWTMNVTERRGFGLNTDNACAVQQHSQIQLAVRQLEEEVHERAETVIVPGFDTDACPLGDTFVNYRRSAVSVGGGAGNPDVRFRLDITNPWDPDIAASFGADTFTNGNTGKLSLKLDTIGTFNLTLLAVSGDQQVQMTSWQMHVHAGPGDRTCGTHGAASHSSHTANTSSANASHRYTCICKQDWGGDNCQIPPSATDNDEPADEPAASSLILLQYALAILGLFTGGVLLFLLKSKCRRQWHGVYDFGTAVATLNIDGRTESPDHAGRVVPKELPRASVVLGAELGRGEFGTVRIARYAPPRGISPLSSVSGVAFDFPVAVKALHDNSSRSVREDFMLEAAITAQFDHPNVVGLIGVVTKHDPLLLVLQFCENGSLSVVVAGARLPQKMLLGFAWHIASGMAYLSSRRFVHRDLAARNVLLGGQNQAKVADFGLSQKVEDSAYYTNTDSDTRMPVRWMAPEVFISQKFGEASDVWAYGITLVEIYSRAVQPYTGWRNFYVLERIKSGYCLPRPADCPVDVYARVIAPCFLLQSHDRPTFQALCDVFASDFPNDVTLRSATGMRIPINLNSASYPTSPGHTPLRSNSSSCTDSSADPHFLPMPPLLVALTAAADQQQQGIGGAHEYEYQLAVEMSDMRVAAVVAPPGMCQKGDAPSSEVPISLLPSPEGPACCLAPKIKMNYAVRGVPDSPLQAAGPDDSSVGANGYTPVSLTGYTAGSFADCPAASPGAPKANATTYTEPAEPTAYVPLADDGRGGTALYAPVDGETPQSAAIPIQAAMGDTAGAVGRVYSTVAYATDQPGHQTAVPNVGEATDGRAPVRSPEAAVTAPIQTAIGDTADAVGAGCYSTAAYAADQPGHQAAPKKARNRLVII